MSGPDSQTTPESPPPAPAEARAESDLGAPELFLNRELAFLEFNRRVLLQAQDRSVPLLERLRFLSICSSNLDEFFEIRVAGLKQQVGAQIGESGPDGLPAGAVLQRVSDVAHDLVTQQYACLNESILPALLEAGIDVVVRRNWDEDVRVWAGRYFEREVLPVLSPVGLDPSHPFPMILNKSLNFLVKLSGVDAFGRRTRRAVVQAPRLLPRLIPMPPDDGLIRFVTLSSIIQHNVAQLFPGMEVTGCHGFRVTRDSDLWVNEEEIDDLMRALKGELPFRQYGDSVRLEVGYGCPDDVSQFLLQVFDLSESDLYRVDGPVNLHRLSALYNLVDRPDLKYPGFRPGNPLPARQVDPFAIIRRGDVLLHHPFESFTPVVELLQQAAKDPAVLAIKVTLYRTGEASPFTRALIDASRAGKEVTAVVELRARFDEAENIQIATDLQEAGAKVVYGIVGYKTHSKMTLIVRRDDDGIRRYVHLGTGNYHLRNTGAYTDFGLLTSDPLIGQDVHDLFLQLTGLGRAGRLKRLVQAPFALHDMVLDAIAAETKAALAGRPARIRAKMNALIDPEIIQALYRASQAGVRIDLVIRGVCALRPGVPGVSSNIRVKSVIGRFLEHARIYNFHADGKEETWLSSADWMPRNFFRRVETAFPVERLDLARRVIEEGLDLYIEDQIGGFELQPDGSYAAPARPPGAASAQARLLDRMAR